jgi:hypothetical protein
MRSKRSCHWVNIGGFPARSVVIAFDPVFLPVALFGVSLTAVGFDLGNVGTSHIPSPGQSFMSRHQQEYPPFMKILSIAAIASVAFAGNALATEGLIIESEAQFVSEYGNQIEQLGPGVYQIISGDLAGKTVEIGEAGLDYALSTERAYATDLPKSSSAKTDSDARIQKLQEEKARYAQFKSILAADPSQKSRINSTISCMYWPWNSTSPTWYGGIVQVSATTEFYLDRGNGTLNWYYARAGASANGYVTQPYGVPVSGSLSANASAYNAYTGQSVFRTAIGTTSVLIGTGYIYSGPNFSHNLSASASVSGYGNCFGYVAISDKMRPND